MSDAASKPPVLIVGGGIGGLSAALALSRKGIPVQVLEQAPEFKEIGAGIQLGPNVFRMFEALGLTQQMFHWCAFPEGLEFRDSITTESIIDMKIDKRFHDKYHAPYAVIHRADFKAGKEIRKDIPDPAPYSAEAMSWHIDATRRDWIGEFIPGSRPP